VNTSWRLVFKIYSAVGRKCRYTMTAGLHIEQSHSARLRLYWYNGQYSINLLHLRPVYTSNYIEATSSNVTNRTILSTKIECCFDIVPVLAIILPFWQQCCRFWQGFRTKFRPFDKVVTNWTCSMCFDFVERKKFYDKLVRHCCHFWQQSRTLL